MTLRKRLMAGVVGFRKFFTPASVQRTQDNEENCPCCGGHTGRLLANSKDLDQFHCVAGTCPLARTKGASWSAQDVYLPSGAYSLSVPGDIAALAKWAANVPVAQKSLPRVGDTGRARLQPEKTLVRVRVVEVNDDPTAWQFYGEPSLRVQKQDGKGSLGMRRLWVPLKNFETAPLKLTHGLELRVRAFDSDAARVAAQTVTVYNPVGQAAVRDGAILVEIPRAPLPNKTATIPVSLFEPD